MSGKFNNAFMSGWNQSQIPVDVALLFINTVDILEVIPLLRW